MSGLELQQQLNLRGATIPVIFITGPEIHRAHVMEKSRRIARGAGAHGHGPGIQVGANRRCERRASK
jgi:hypothetical protein